MSFGEFTAKRTGPQKRVPHPGGKGRAAAIIVVAAILLLLAFFVVPSYGC